MFSAAQHSGYTIPVMNHGDDSIMHQSVFKLYLADKLTHLRGAVNGL